LGIWHWSFSVFAVTGYCRLITDYFQKNPDYLVYPCKKLNWLGVSATILACVVGNLTTNPNGEKMAQQSCQTELPQQIDIDIRVRYPEVDQMGALHHSRYWVYFEMGRTELLRSQGVSYHDLEEAGVLFVVAKCAAKFLAPARYDDVLSLSTRITKTGAARIDHAYELRRKADGLVLATGESTIACVNRQGRIIAIPEKLK